MILKLDVEKYFAFLAYLERFRELFFNLKGKQLKSQVIAIIFMFITELYPLYKTFQKLLIVFAQS